MKVKKWWYTTTTPKFREYVKLYYQIDLGVLIDLIKLARIEHKITSKTITHWSLISYTQQLVQLEIIENNEVILTKIIKHE